jgi:hypothetical protein
MPNSPATAIISSAASAAILISGLRRGLDGLDYEPARDCVALAHDREHP